VEAIDLLNNVLRTEELYHSVIQTPKSAKTACIKPVNIHRVGDTAENAPNRLIELVRNSVLLEAQTNVCIPRDLEVALNTAVTAGELDAAQVAATAIREHLVAHEAADNPYRTWQP